MTKNHLAASFGLISLLYYASAQASCGTTTCSINTNWDDYGASHPGWDADLRYSYSRADTLRSGSHKISADTRFAGEVENLRTLNRIVTTGLDYTYDNHWGITLQLPFITRDHNHNLGPYTGGTPAGYESFHASAMGDIKTMGRYRWALDEARRSGMGVKFGLKLTTGGKNFVIDQTGAVPGEVTLQPGNGSTDLIIGTFWFQSTPGSDWNGFAQATAQISIYSIATFRPGNQINLDGGTRYAFSQNLSGVLQLNMQFNNTDSGSAAALSPASGEPNSGARMLSLTPGLSYALTPSTQLYGLLQLPLHQYVNGEQLTANASISIGISQRF